MKRIYFYAGTEENKYIVYAPDTEENRAAAKQRAIDGVVYSEEYEVPEPESMFTAEDLLNALLRVSE